MADHGNTRLRSDAQRNRDHILQVAHDALAESGATSLNEIAKRAGVGPGTLYRHFPSKDHLIAAYLERRMRYDQEQVSGIIASHADDPHRALAELATALTRDDFAAMRRGCPFINASAEFAAGHPLRDYATRIRAWVIETLGPLADDDGHSSLLRDTLRVFLQEGGSFKATAERLTLHKNTVQYRVRKAEESLGRPVGEDRLNVGLALLASQWLGAAVLRPAGATQS